MKRSSRHCYGVTGAFRRASPTMALTHGESMTACMHEGKGASFWTSVVNTWFFSELPDNKNRLFTESPTVYRRKRVALYEKVIVWSGIHECNECIPRYGITYLFHDCHARVNMGLRTAQSTGHAWSCTLQWSGLWDVISLLQTLCWEIGDKSRS